MLWRSIRRLRVMVPRLLRRPKEGSVRFRFLPPLFACVG